MSLKDEEQGLDDAKNGVHDPFDERLDSWSRGYNYDYDRDFKSAQEKMRQEAEERAAVDEANARMRN